MEEYSRRNRLIYIDLVSGKQIRNTHVFGNHINIINNIKNEKLCFKSHILNKIVAFYTIEYTINKIDNSTTHVITLYGNVKDEEDTRDFSHDYYDYRERTLYICERW